MKPFAIIEKKTKPREDPDRYRIVEVPSLSKNIEDASWSIVELFESKADAETYLSKLHFRGSYDRANVR
jgi:hypothetical protein